MPSINGPLSPVQPPEPVRPASRILNLDGPFEIPEVKPGETTCPAAPLEAASSKGLLDYPKDLAMAVTEAAARGQAKNTVEFLADISDLKEAAQDAGAQLKEGQLGQAALSAGRVGWNVLSGFGNMVQAGVSAAVGGISTTVSLPLSALDAGAEAAGKAASKSDSAAGKFVGKALKLFVGENSSSNYFESVNRASGEAAQKARSQD